MATFRVIGRSLLLGILSLSGLLVSAQDRPNVVLILGDDQAWTDYGFMGHPEIKTPNLDQLAARSLVFERGYVASPLCRPSLASIVTGLFPFDHGITGNDVDGRNDRARLDVPLRRQFHQHTSFIRQMTDSDYRAHQSGKWWEGSFADGGFTHGMTHGDAKRGGRHGDAGLKIGREGMQPVLEFIDEAVEDEQSFCVWYAPFLPHTPHNPPARLLRKYVNGDRPADVAKYYAMCEWFDETCGTLLDHLEQKGVADNTLVVFLCDNGWAARSTNADDPDQSSWPSFALRSKGSPFENGVRTPILISWPARLRPERCKDLAHAIDIFPTIAAATGLKVPPNRSGINLLERASREQRRRVFGVTHSIHNMSPGEPDRTLQYLWCVDREWKLIQRFAGEDTTKYRKVHAWDATPLRLYHLATDPHEKTNLATEHPDIAARLKGAISDWRTGSAH